MQLTFKPKQSTKKLLSVLKERSRDILGQRFGLTPLSSKRKTLEAIGQQYGITRERVRQIEDFSLSSIRKSDTFSESQDIFENIFKEIEARGNVVNESDFLSEIGSDEFLANHIHFLLVVSPLFTKIREDDNFYHRWAIDIKHSDLINQALVDLHSEIDEEDLISESEIISFFAKILEKYEIKNTKNEVLRNWLNISKHIDSNALGEWGPISSPNVRPRGVRDLAFLVLKKHGSPMHFTEVAQVIGSTFSRDAHPQTTHNELIKDGRFVLVGRGIYCLKDWGYTSGTVKDVIKNILGVKKEALSREDIIKRVLKERYVKENTILVNLQDRSYFKRDNKGRYILVR